MDSSTWSVLLLLIGLLLLVAEVFIPSGGLISVLAVACLAGATWCAWNAWWVRSPGYFWGFLASMAVLLPVVVWAAFSIWPNTAIGRRAILEAPTPSEVASFVELEGRLSRLVGATGEAVTVLNPAGIVRIQGERVHCQSDGSVIIERGVSVKVISVKGNRVVVRRWSAPESDAAPQAVAKLGPEPVAKPDPPHMPPLDFDLP